jgi:hypothetical protein
MMRVLAVLAAVLLVGCDDEQSDRLDAVSNSHASTAPEFCGGQVRPGVIEGYFRTLAAALSEERTSIPPELYDARLGDDDRPSRADWNEIRLRGAAALQEAGWRGCFLASGKAWFEADGDSFVLKRFNPDMPWDRHGAK